MHYRILFLVFISAWMMASSADAQDAALQSALEKIKAVDINGQGHDAAVQAIEVLNNASAEDVPTMLQGMTGANKLAQNWIRGGIQSALKTGPLPRAQIRAYLDDSTGSHMGRLMAFELLSDADPSFAAKHVGSMLQDPSLPLRQLAVADFITRARNSEETDEIIGILAQALPHAREVDQISSIAKLLGEHNVNVDLQKQLGVIANWHIVGKFDNRREQGFDKVLGPEKAPADVDLQANYEDSKTGEPVSWQRFNSTDATGIVDLNDLLGEEKGVIAYAYTEFDSAEEQDIDIRIGCINGNKVWINGQEVINNEVYHVGMMPDQFKGKAKLKKGINKILFKICQNEQTQPWANRWMFQLRVCESDGKAVLPVEPAQPQ